MGHNLHVNKSGQASFFQSELKPAWHGLGQNIGHALTAKEALKEANLGFEVTLEPIYTKKGRRRVEIPNKFATVRSDEGSVLGVVGNKYKVIQNVEAFSFFDSVVSKDEAIYHSAGVLGLGERVWIMAKLPRHIKILGIDEIELYIVITNTHDGSGSMLAFLSPTRVVCENTLEAAIHGGQRFIKIRHTKSASDKIVEAHKLMGISNSLQEELDQIFNMMAKRRVTVTEQKAFIEDFLLPLPKLPIGKDDYGREPSVIKYRAELWDAVRDGIGQDMKTTEGTAFGLFNGVTYWLDHTKKYTSDKLNNLWFGNASKIRQTSFDYLSAISM